MTRRPPTNPQSGPRAWERHVGPLEGLFQQARRLQQAGSVLTREVPQLAAHCTLTNVREGTAVIAAESAAWATRARYAGQQLTEAVRRALPEARVTAVKVTVRPRPEPLPGPVSRPPGPILPPEASAMLSSVATGMDYCALRSSLLRLAGRSRSEGRTGVTP